MELPGPAKLLSTGTGSPERRLNHHPWTCLKTCWMQRSGTWFCGGLLELRVGWLGCGWTWWPWRCFPIWAVLWFYDYDTPLLYVCYISLFVVFFVLFKKKKKTSFLTSNSACRLISSARCLLKINSASLATLTKWSFIFWLNNLWTENI